MQKTAVILFLPVFVVIAIALSGNTYAAQICSGGATPHLATQQEAAAASGGGIIAGVTYVCPNDARLGISNSAGAAKEYLLSIAQGLPGTKAPPDRNHIAQLNSAFAVCAAGFLKAYSQNYGAVRITSAYRDGPSGENAAAGGAPGSNHTRGLAIDVGPTNGDYKRMWDFAKANPQFGVCFPHEGFDRPHMILGGIGGTEGGKCMARGISKPCSGVNFDPNEVKPAYSSNTPTAALAERLRQAALMSQLQQPPPPPPPQQTQQPSTSGQQPSSSQSPATTDPGYTSTTQQPSSPTPVSTLLSPAPVATNPNTTVNDQPPLIPTLELLKAIAFPLSATSTEVGTSSSVSLTVSTLREIAGLTTSTPPQAASSTITASGTIVTIQPRNAQPTFTSPELNTPGSQYSPQQLSTFQNALSQIKEVLMRMLVLLQPFRGFGDYAHTE